MVKYIELVTYLRKIGVEPNCSASSLLSSTNYGIHYPIDYQNTRLTTNFFHSDTQPSITQWWALDLHSFVRLKSYQILSRTWCNWVNTWTFEISLDKITWKTVHSYNNFTFDEIFQLNQIEVAQYIRIKGNNEGCSQSGTLAFSRIYLYGYPMHIQTCEMKKQISLKIFLSFIVFIAS